MKRVAILVLRIAFVPFGLVVAPRIYEVLNSHAPSVDRFTFPYGHLAIETIFQTIVAVFVTALVVFPAQRLYGRFARLAAVAVVMPILLEESPFNSTYHDYHWRFLDWALASYATLIIFLLVLWFTSTLRSPLSVLTCGWTDSRVGSSVGQGGTR
jgi:hypothetical protein